MAIHFYIYKDTNGHWRWFLTAANNRKIANSGEGHHNEQDCRWAIGLVMDTTRNTPILKV